MAGPNMLPWLKREAQTAPKAFRNREFVRLRAEWYAKLRDTGFDDAEFESLTGYDGRLEREYERGMPSEQYYRLAGWWLHDRVWPSRRTRVAFELHADGLSYREVAVRMQPMRGTHFGRLQHVIAAEAERMKAHYLQHGGA